jgi:hypothetical protein
MRNMKTRKASGRASALRVGHTIAQTANFKTRNDPCRIAVRADPEKSVHPKENRPRFGPICASLGANLCRILSRGAVTLRFAENRKLKTENPQRSCTLRFPYAARRCNSTGLPEQMP